MNTQDRLIKRSFIMANAHQLKDTEINLIYKFMKVTLETEEKPVANFQCSDGLVGLKLKAKLFIDGNVWDGEDRSGAKNDRATFNPDELQDLVDDLMENLAY